MVEFSSGDTKASSGRPRAVTGPERAGAVNAVASLCLVVTLMAAGAAGCILNTTICSCNTEFATVRFRAVDVYGEPVRDLDLVVKVTRTGEVITPHDQSLNIFGDYTVFDDSFQDLVFEHLPDWGFVSLSVWGSSPSGVAMARFVVTVPGGCKCHVHKVSGPDTVIVKPPL
jgi:hypothetical protein